MERQRAPLILDGHREASWGALSFVCLTATAAVIVFLWTKLFALGVLWILCVGVGVFLWGRQRLRDVGLSGKNFLPGIAYAIVYWAVAVGLITIGELVRGMPLQRPIFNGNIGPLIKQLLVFGLAEEVVFRAFIMVQLYRKLRKVCTVPTLALPAAILLSQLFFALWHVPNRLSANIPVIDMVPSLGGVFAAGVLFSVVYVRTRNLLTALAVHALSNIPGLYGGTVSLWSQLGMLCVAVLLAELYARLESKHCAKMVCDGRAAT